jgi:hypothetical protein
MNTMGLFEFEAAVNTQPATVRGTFFKLHNNEALPIEGNFTGNVLSATAGDVTLAGTLDMNQAICDGTASYDGQTYNFSSTRCELR